VNSRAVGVLNRGVISRKIKKKIARTATITAIPPVLTKYRAIRSISWRCVRDGPILEDLFDDRDVVLNG
jgi:hypothetical protein